MPNRTKQCLQDLLSLARERVRLVYSTPPPREYLHPLDYLSPVELSLYRELVRNAKAPPIMTPQGKRCRVPSRRL
jgi:hypothetical protein